MAFVRHVKVTLRRAKNINACTIGRSRTKVIAKASYKNLVYTTSMVEDMGLNPAWENDGTNVFHFDFKDESEYITLGLFNRNNNCIGVSKLYFSDLAHLLPGKSEGKILPVMVTSHKQFGDLVLVVEIMEQQAMGELGLLSVELQKGFIEGITSILKSKTTEISAKLIYKHTTYTSGILKKMGNKFVWHEDNTFTFIINSFKADDILRLEVYNLQAKVGECEMLMSLFIEQEENLRADRSEVVARSTDLSLEGRGPVGNIELAASFTKPICRRNSFPQTQHPSAPHSVYPPPYHSTSHHNSPTLHCQPPQVYPPPPGLYPPLAPQVNPSPSFNPWSASELHRPAAEAHLHPSASFNPRSSALRPELYPPAGPDLYNPMASLDPRHPSTARLHPSVADKSNLHSYSPSAPEYLEVVTRGSLDTVLLSQDYQNAHGAPAGRAEAPLNRDSELDEEMKKFIDCFHSI